MAATFELEIATPERLVIREQVTEAQVPGADGAMGILPDHAPLISELGIGELSYVGGGQKHTIAVGNGVVEVLDNHVRVLADRAEQANEIDVARAQAALKRAEERVARGASGEIDVARALNAMRRAQARLAVANAR